MPDPVEHRLNRFGTPFRVGSTSYVYPDDILPNVERLAQQGDVDDVELILFEVDDGPLDLQLGADGGAQHASLIKAERVIKTTLPLSPHAYVFHLDGAGVGEAGWIKNALKALDFVIAWVGAPELLAVENLEAWDPAYLDPVLAALPISRTTDI